MLPRMQNRRTCPNYTDGYLTAGAGRGENSLQGYSWGSALKAKVAKQPITFRRAVIALPLLMMKKLPPRGTIQ